MTVRTTVHLQGIVEVPFDILVPDPNRTGLDPPTADPAAEQAFAEAVDAAWSGSGRCGSSDALADGAGGVVLSSARYAAPDRFQLLTAEGDASIAVGPTQAFTTAGGAVAHGPPERAVPLPDLLGHLRRCLGPAPRPRRRRWTAARPAS